MTTPTASVATIDLGDTVKRHITIHGETGEDTIDTKDVYFAFPDGGWAYDCRACGAQCCRGHGYSFGGPTETLAHLDGRRTLHLFTKRAGPGSNAVTVQNFKPGCFMLTPDGTCRIQTEHGFIAKPETCRLFNTLKRIGRYLIVAPHIGLCPLAWSAGTAVESCHDRLLRQMELAPIVQRVPRVVSGRVDPDTAIRLERELALLSASSAPRTFEDFVVEQIKVSRLITGSSDSTADSNVHSQVRSYADQLRETLGVWPSTSADIEPQLLRTMVSAAPSIRALMVFIPRNTEPMPPLDRIPYILLTLQKVVALAAEAGMSTATYQTAFEVLRAYRGLFSLSAWLDVHMRWDVRARVALYPAPNQADDTFDASLQLAHGLLSSTDRKRPLGQLLASCCGEAPEGRLQKLEQLSSSCTGRLVPHDERRPNWLIPRSVSQNVLAYAGPHTLSAVSLAVRRHDRRSSSTATA